MLSLEVVVQSIIYYGKIYKNGIIEQPFAFGLSSSEKVIKSGFWAGNNKDQFKTTLFNHNMKKTTTTGKKRKGKSNLMTPVSNNNMFDLYRELDSQYSVCGKSISVPNFNKMILDLIIEIYFTNMGDL